MKEQEKTVKQETDLGVVEDTEEVCAWLLAALELALEKEKNKQLAERLQDQK